MVFRAALDKQNVLVIGPDNPGISVFVRFLNVNDRVVGHKGLNADNFLAVERAFGDLEELRPMRHKIASRHSADRHEGDSIRSRTESIDDGSSGPFDRSPRSVLLH